MAACSTEGLGYLPDDVMIMICKYLTGQELAAMCATSRLWRNRLNEDVYWRWRCDAEQAHYLKETECIVKPHFVSPEVEGSGLSNVCEWRLNYMRQNHLHNNWLRGKTKKYSIPREPKDSFYCISLFYKNDFFISYSLVTSSDETRRTDGKIQIWNVKEKPFIESEYTTSSEHENAYKYMHKSHHKMYLSGDFVVLLQRCLVQVFTISQSLELQLKHAFHFTQSEILSEPLKQQFQVPQDGVNYGTAAFSTALMGPILLGILILPNFNKTMHVWNAETGVKLKEEVCQDEGCVFEAIHNNYSSKSNRAILFVKKPDSTFKIVIYCLVKLAFKDFFIGAKAPRFYEDIISSLGHWLVIVNKQFLALKSSRNNNLEVYDIESNQLVQTQRMSGTNGICSYGNNIVFVDDNTLRSVNAVSSEVSTIYDSRKGVYLSSIVLDKYILFFQVDKHTTQQRPKICFVKDKNNIVVRNFQSTFAYSFSANTFSSKVLSVQNKSLISVYTFW